MGIADLQENKHNIPLSILMLFRILLVNMPAMKEPTQDTIIGNIFYDTMSPYLDERTRHPFVAECAKVYGHSGKAVRFEGEIQ